MENIINGVNLQKAANVIVDQYRQDDLTNIPNKSIIWCKTDYLGDVFTKLKNTKHKDFILITHCSDHSITEKVFNYKPLCIKKWFAQNVNYNHPDLIPLPIGLENHYGPNKGSYTDFEHATKEAFDFQIRNKIINKLYCNFRLTHPSRTETIQILQQTNKGKFENNVPYNLYCNNVKNFLFIASPRGNGIDAHRTWEALYYGSIPIVEKHFMYDTYKNLPIIQVNTWWDVTDDLLQTYINKYKNNELFTNTEELTLQYWIQKIKHTVSSI